MPGTILKLNAKAGDAVKKGDVLCFDTNDDGTVDHTAIALVDGGGSFIEASENAGKVQTNTMTDWYKERFKLARRII
jgi:cell wall-associated NlpC family hydrolase